MSICGQIGIILNAYYEIQIYEFIVRSNKNKFFFFLKRDQIV